MKERLFSVFGIPYILHSDNGREFVNNLIVDTIEAWYGECELANGIARSPWVKGFVEKGSHCVEMMITVEHHGKSSNDWVSWIIMASLKHYVSITFTL